MIFFKFGIVASSLALVPNFNFLFPKAIPNFNYFFLIDRTTIFAAVFIGDLNYIILPTGGCFSP